ncbi:MAG: TraR/DksA C4-type zinc finger protein [Endomicrobium sp.]|jgi:DnaK suppressor protein|nr:TraR/DksA C4-type zinc finger protein [Endomicrobium sp.]
MINKKDLNNLKKILIQKKIELLNKSNNNSNIRMNINSDVGNIGDEIDAASQNNEKEMYFEFASNDKLILNAVNNAIDRIKKDIYGKCECCNNFIPIGRLKVIPWTEYCIECKEKIENKK